MAATPQASVQGDSNAKKKKKKNTVGRRSADRKKVTKKKRGVGVAAANDAEDVDRPRYTRVRL